MLWTHSRRRAEIERSLLPVTVSGEEDTGPRSRQRHIRKSNRPESSRHGGRQKQTMPSRNAEGRIERPSIPGVQTTVPGDLPHSFRRVAPHHEMPGPDRDGNASLKAEFDPGDRTISRQKNLLSKLISQAIQLFQSGQWCHLVDLQVTNFVEDRVLFHDKQ